MNNTNKKIKFIKISENKNLNETQEGGVSKNKFSEDHDSLIFGIDFGTTNTVVSYELNDEIKFITEKNLERNELIKDSKNKKFNSFKTVLTVREVLENFDKEKLEEEENQFFKNLKKYENFNSIEIAGFKRFIGKTFPKKNEIEEKKFNEENNFFENNYVLQNENEFFLGFSSYQLSTCFFKKIKKIICETFKLKKISAVFTVPAHFNNLSRKMIRTAANEAGFKVLRLLNEPTSAAIAYGTLEDEKEGTFLIYDFGGGTFDVSILKYHSKIFEVLGTDGNLFIGGDDIDNELLKLSELKNNSKNLQKIREIKENFESQKNLKIRNLDYETFKKVVQKYSEKTLTIVKRLMMNLEINKNDLKKIIMVGGSSQLFEIKKTLMNYFGEEKIYDKINPYDVVSIGASIYAKTIQKKSINERILLDVTPFSIGIETGMGGAEKIIPKFSHTPIEASMNFTTFYKKQKKILINVLEGESNFANECTKIGCFELDISEAFNDLKSFDEIKKIKNEIELKVTFKIDTDGILEVEAYEKKSKMKKKIVIEKFY